MIRDALAGMTFLPRTLADFQESMAQSAAGLNIFSESLENTLPANIATNFSEAAVPDGTNTATGNTDSLDGADAAARTLLALADAGSGFEKQLLMLNPSVRAVALANEAVASQISTLSVEPPVLEAVAQVSGLAAGGQPFQRLTAPFITQGSGLSDDVPALLMRDEFVMRKAAVKKYGLPLMYALNNCELPDSHTRGDTAELSTTPGPFPAARVAAYASGGVVSSSKDDDEDEDTWSLTVSGSSVSPESFYHSFSAPADATWSDADLSDYAAELVQGVRDSLDIRTMQNDPQSYLDSILAAFSTDSQALRIFGSGGSSSMESSALQQEKARINEAYAAKIQNAKDLGNVELSELFQLQLNTLLELIDELAYALEQLAQEYRDSVEDALADYEDEFQNIQEDAGEQLAALQSRYQALAEGSSLISSLGGNADSEKSLQGQTKSQMRSVENERSEAEQEAEDNYVARTERLLKTLKIESAFEARTTDSQGDKERIESTADLQRAYLETLQDIRDLEVERDEQLAELADEYTTGTIAETSEYLNMGGVVGRLSDLAELLKDTRLGLAGMFSGAVQTFAQGGLVSGGVQGKDSVPALLMPGEYVLNTRAVEHIGLTVLEKANALRNHWGGLPDFSRFAQGGLVNAASLEHPRQEHLIRFDLGRSQPTVRTDSENMRSLVRGLKQMRKRMVS